MKGTCGFCGGPAIDPAHPYCCVPCFTEPGLSMAAFVRILLLAVTRK